MKKLILSLFICLLSVFCSTYGQVYQSTYSNDPRTNSRIGYTTQYGYGFRQNSTPVTYNPIGATQPKRITVYNGSGGTANTPGGNNDSSDWLYMQDSEGNWYCSKDGGNTWYLWTEKTYGSGILGWLEYLGDMLSGNTEAWSTTPTTPPDGSSHWAPDPDDPFLEPVGDIPIFFIIALICFYSFSYKRV